MPGNMETDLTKLTLIIKQVAAVDTSADPERWIPQNPLWGHCAVTSLIVQDYFGGTLWRIDLSSIPELSYLRSHYLNVLDTGELVDLTCEQFSTPLPESLPFEERSRDSILSHTDTERRYQLLKERLDLDHEKSHPTLQTSSPQ
jgi:hypothetical protein